MTVTLPAASADIETIIRESKQGVSASQAELAKYYILGNTVTQDHKRAMYWLSLAKEQNNPDALTILGYMYHTGQGVEQDFVSAYSYYAKAADLGNKEAQTMLNILQRTFRVGDKILGIK